MEEDKKTVRNASSLSLSSERDDLSSDVKPSVEGMVSRNIRLEESYTLSM